MYWFAAHPVLITGTHSTFLVKPREPWCLTSAALRLRREGCWPPHSMFVFPRRNAHRDGKCTKRIPPLNRLLCLNSQRTVALFQKEATTTKATQGAETSDITHAHPAPKSFEEKKLRETNRHLWHQETTCSKSEVRA